MTATRGGDAATTNHNKGGCAVAPAAPAHPAERPARPTNARRGGKACAVAGCDRPAASRDWCKAHYDRWHRTGDVQADTPIRTGKPTPCRITGCGRPVNDLYTGLCEPHLHRRSLRPDIPIGAWAQDWWPGLPGNPWAGHRPCPECRSARWTMPRHGRWTDEPWVCIAPAHPTLFFNVATVTDAA